MTQNKKLDPRKIKRLVETENKTFFLLEETEASSEITLSDRKAFIKLLDSLIEEFKAIRKDRELFDYIRSNKPESETEIEEIIRIESRLNKFLMLEKESLITVGLDPHLADEAQKTTVSIIQEIKKSKGEPLFWPPPWNRKGREKRATKLRSQVSDLIYILEETQKLARKEYSEKQWKNIRSITQKALTSALGITTIFCNGSFLASSAGLTSGASAVSIFIGGRMVIKAMESKEIS